MHPRLRMNLQDGHQPKKFIGGGFFRKNSPQTACGQYIRLWYLHILVLVIAVIMFFTASSPRPLFVSTTRAADTMQMQKYE